MAILALALIAAILVVLQLALPPIAERQAEKQLTEHGGTAHVDLKALPSVRLLRKEGDSIKIRASGLVTPPRDVTSKGTLSDLDGFDEVDIQVVGMHVGPLTIARLTMQRQEPDHPYETNVQATVTPAAIATFAGTALGGGVGGFLGGLAGNAMPGASTPIPIDLEATLTSDRGAIRATQVSGSVAGLPAGPFVEAITAALAGRL